MQTVQAVLPLPDSLSIKVILPDKVVRVIRYPESISDWIHLAQDMDQWRALVNTVMNLRVT
jgi:hypothetical protein